MGNMALNLVALGLVFCVFAVCYSVKELCGDCSCTFSENFYRLDEIMGKKANGMAFGSINLSDVELGDVFGLDDDDDGMTVPIKQGSSWDEVHYTAI